MEHDPGAVGNMGDRGCVGHFERPEHLSHQIPHSIFFRAGRDGGLLFCRDHKVIHHEACRPELVAHSILTNLLCPTAMLNCKSGHIKDLRNVKTGRSAILVLPKRALKRATVSSSSSAPANSC